MQSWSFFFFFSLEVRELSFALSEVDHWGESAAWHRHLHLSARARGLKTSRIHLDKLSHCLLRAALVFVPNRMLWVCQIGARAGARAGCRAGSGTGSGQVPERALCCWGYHLGYFGPQTCLRSVRDVLVGSFVIKLTTLRGATIFVARTSTPSSCPLTQLSKVQSIPSRQIPISLRRRRPEVTSCHLGLRLQAPAFTLW